LNKCAIRYGWQGRFQVLLQTALTVACGATTYTAEIEVGWILAGPLLLFLGLLTLLNAPFDCASLGLTRALLRRGIELGGWRPYSLAAVDAVAAACVIALLTLVTVLGVHVFDTLAGFSGGREAQVLPLGPLFAGIASRPAAPEFWWVYAMLLSTMIPSLVNLPIGGASLLRGIPWVTALVLRNMSDRRAPPAFERTWMTLLLTLQVFLGGLLGIAAQGFLARLPVFSV
jgi:hypothetical protein